MAVLLALGSALAWGAGDFCGGLAARRLPSMALALRAHLIGLVALVALQLLLVRSDAPGAGSLGWGAVAGLAGGAGLVLFYRALATGTMSVVAPVSGVTAAVVPVVAGTAAGERPGALAGLGLLAAFAAIALVGAGESPLLDGPASTEVQGPRTLSPLAMSVASGVGFGLFAVAVERAGDDAGVWPLIAGRSASVAAFAALVVATGQRVQTPGPVRLLVAATALLDAGANALYLFAVGRGLLSIVGAVVALYPASTVVLARIVLGERLARRQQLGLGAAVIAVVLVAGP